MGFSATHLIILGIVCILLFGGGRFSAIMVDVAKGMKDFKKGMADDDAADPAPVARIAQRPDEPAVERDRAERSPA